MSEIEYKKAIKDISTAQRRMNAGDNTAYNDYRTAEFRAFDALYDSSTREGINAIPVPELLLSKRGSVTGNAEYILTLRAGEYEKNGNIDLAICCFKKANELRQTGSTVYCKSDYMRLVEALKKARRFDEAREEETKINRLFDIPKESIDSMKKRLLSQCAKGDLVELSRTNACCEICAKYRGRVFSLYGSDKRFPLFPEDYHDECGIVPFPFIYGITSPQYCTGSIIKYSNRPFLDDRTAQEKKDYAAILKQKEEEHIRELDKQDYDWLWEFMPEICPKSFNAYRRAKNANTETFQKIVSQANANGYTFKARKPKKSVAKPRTAPAIPAQKTQTAPTSPQTLGNEIPSLIQSAISSIIKRIMN